MRNFSLAGALALLAASAVTAEEEYNMNMPCFNDICWTSWKCRYSRTSKYDKELNDRCNLPNNVYVPGVDRALYNTLVWGQDYYMRWTSNYASQSEDIVLEWLNFVAPGTESKTRYHHAMDQANTSCRANPRERDRHVPGLPRPRA